MIARTKIAVATRLNGSWDARCTRVASSPSGDAGGYAESGVGSAVSAGVVGAMPYDSGPAEAAAIAATPAGE